MRRSFMTLVLLAIAAAAGWYQLGGTDDPAAVPDPGGDGCPVLSLHRPASDGSVLLPAAQLRPGRVSFTQELTVVQTHNLGRYGQLTLAAGGRVFHPNNGTCSTAWDRAERLVVLEDGNSRQNVSPVPFLQGDTLRAGTTVTGLEGWLDHGPVHMAAGGLDEHWYVEPGPAPRFNLTAGSRPAAPPETGGDLMVAGFNVENWFTSLDGRGARDQRELGRQQAKLVAALAGLDADIIGLAEVENNGGNSLRALLDGSAGRPGLNHQPGGNYDYVIAGGFGAGTDAIGLAFLYRPSVVRPVGPSLGDEAFVHTRPPLLQEFEHVATGERFTLVMAHLKSRGGCEPYDPDDGSGCWNSLRERQASALTAFVARNARSPVLLLGDYNAYALESPMQQLQEEGYVDLLARYVPASERYTYIFSPGHSGYIDHALADEEMLDFVCGAAVWHINADEPVLLHYTGARFGPDMYAPDQYRSSDHDPVLVGLRFSGC